MDLLSLYEERLNDTMPTFTYYCYGTIIEVAYADGLRKLDPVLFNEGLKEFENSYDDEDFQRSI